MSTPAGEKKTVIQNTSGVSKKEKLVNAWRGMARELNRIHLKLYTNKTILINDLEFSYIDNIYPYVNFNADIFDAEDINIYE
jgi:hypothetical protein